MVKKKTNKYWQARLAKEMEHRIQTDEAIAEEMKRMYILHRNNIEKEIESFLQRYGSGEQLSAAELRKKVSDMDVQAFAERAKQYVTEKNFSPQANGELKLYNLKMKISRLELLQYYIDLELVALTDGEHKLTEKYLNQAYIDELNLQSGILGELMPSPETIRLSAEALVNMPYEGAVWSDRIWQRQNILRNVVSDIARNAVYQGKSARTAIPELRKTFGVGEYEARRLAVTEVARVQTEVSKLSYETNGYTQFDLIPEPTACEKCKAVADKGPYKVSEMEAGKNAAPLHPFCMCAEAPHVDRAELEAMFEELERMKALGLFE